MSYNTDRSGSTLSDSDMSAEGKRILERIRDSDYSHLTSAAQSMVIQKLEELDNSGSVGITVKQLYFLRDISDKVD